MFSVLEVVIIYLFRGQFKLRSAFGKRVAGERDGVGGGLGLAPSAFFYRVRPSLAPSTRPSFHLAKPSSNSDADLPQANHFRRCRVSRRGSGSPTPSPRPSSSISTPKSTSTTNSNTSLRVLTRLQRRDPRPTPTPTPSSRAQTRLDTTTIPFSDFRPLPHQLPTPHPITVPTPRPVHPTPAPTQKSP